MTVLFYNLTFYSCYLFSIHIALKSLCVFPQEFLKSFVTPGWLSVKLLDNCMFCPHYSIFVIVGYKHSYVCLMLKV